MTDKQVNALAAFLAEGRADWQAPGIVAELRRQREHYDPWQLATAMCKRAADPKNLTPQLQPFDRQGFVPCRQHPTAGTRTDGRCGACRSDQLAVADDVHPVRPHDDPGHPLRDAVGRL